MSALATLFAIIFAAVGLALALHIWLSADARRKMDRLDNLIDANRNKFPLGN